MVALREIADLGDVDHEQQDVRDIDLPSPLDQAGGADHGAALEHHARIDEGCRVAGDEDEQIGGVAEAEVLLGNPIHRVVRDMVEIDRPVGEATQQVQTIVAATRWQDSFDVHRFAPHPNARDSERGVSNA